MASHSVVNYLGKHENYKCGYCKSSDTSVSHGLWGHYLTPQDYQDMINRGWRRSGRYCYKPAMDLTCCPQYTIRCQALDFKLSKSQKKVLKKMSKFLASGIKKNADSECNNSSLSEENNEQPMEQCHPDLPKQELAIKDMEIFMQESGKASSEEMTVPSNHISEEMSEIKDKKMGNTQVSPSSSSSRNQNTKDITKISGPNPSLPRCKKAKEIRRERRMQKLLDSGCSMEDAIQATKPKQGTGEKSIEEFLNESVPNPAHRLELRLVSVNLENEDFMSTFKDSYALYKRYQMIVHKESEDECDLETFKEFLILNPFKPVSNAASKLHGAFHQQYWIDNKLIAVGVLDILPHCVSSVYFYYDPEYNFLSLGTYSSLREIAFTRELNKRYPELLYYYMGFYIHSCSKMKYKGSYSPSYLLCPETYSFFPIENCLLKLAVAKYQRFEEDTEKGDVDGAVSLAEVMILYGRQAMSYARYCQINKHADDRELVEEYAQLIGRKCYQRALLYRD